MSVYRLMHVRCDHAGCGAEVPSSADSVHDARGRTGDIGWSVVVERNPDGLVTRDFCPSHAPRRSA